MPKRVLLIEADNVFARGLTEAIEAIGAEVIRTRGGHKGLSLAENEPLDAILVSAELPDTSGHDVCNQIKKNDWIASIPLLLMTGEGTRTTPEEKGELRRKADAYISKPFDINEIVKIVESMLGPAESWTQAEKADPFPPMNAAFARLANGQAEQRPARGAVQPESERRRLQALRERADRKLRSAMRLGFLGVAALYAALLVVAAVGWGAALLSSKAPILENLSVAFLAVAGVVAIWLVSRPISIATHYDFDWMVFKTYVWLIPILMVAWLPAVGGILGGFFGLIMAIYLWRGRFGESRINSGGVSGSTSTYDAVQLENGEGRPAALYFLGLGLLLRPTLLPLLDPEGVQALLARVGLL